MSGRAGKAGAPRGLAGPRAEKSVSLALQGGGAHGAFTWGVLDAIIEDGRLAIEAITGASAGSMNAVVLAEGWLKGGPEEAREHLRKFWKRVSLDGVLSPLQRSLFDQFLGFWSADRTPGHLWLEAWSRVASPYEFNSLDYNPLKAALEELIDFQRVRRNRTVKLFVAATRKKENRPDPARSKAALVGRSPALVRSGLSLPGANETSQSRLVASPVAKRQGG